MSECDLCNQEAPVSNGTVMNKLSSGGLVKLCSKCWDKLDSPSGVCALCQVEVSTDPSKNVGVNENRCPEASRGGIICSDCRRIIDWNH
jgi:predicted amidophosphoribosyltransferase